jgi:hypothetical protein
MNRTAAEHDRQPAIRAFARATFGPRGTLRLHRSAFGADLLRAPANVFLAPLFLLSRLAGALAQKLRYPKTALWILQRKILLQTHVSRQVERHVMVFLDDLDAQGLGISAPDTVVARAVSDYAGVRNAISEITTALIVLIAGYLLFHTATPGVISLAGPVADLQAQARAIAQFPFGQGLGRIYYGVVSTTPSPWQLAGTAVILALLASVVTSFAGVIADPLQVLTGTHRRRLSRLLARLDRCDDTDAPLAREHIAARLTDITDMMLNIWRAFRG